MTADVLERQMDIVATRVRNCSDHQLSMVRILRGDAAISAPCGPSAMHGPSSGSIASAPTVDPTAPAPAFDIGVPTPELVTMSSIASDPFQEFFAPIVHARAGPFDDIIAAVASPRGGRARPRGPLPPPSRFMMRVAPVDRPHRATKRNYDYFGELNAALSQISHKSRTDADGTAPTEEQR